MFEAFVVQMGWVSIAILVPAALLLAALKEQVRDLGLDERGTLGLRLERIRATVPASTDVLSS